MATDFKLSAASMSSFKSSKDESINSNDVINKILTQNKDLKVAMSKMLERNKVLQLDCDKLNEDLTHNNQKYTEL